MSALSAATSAPDSDQHACYSVALPDGNVEISIFDVASNDFDMIGSTLELAKHEPLIQVIENWLGYGLDLEYSKAEFLAPALFSVTNTEASPQRVEISLPTSTWVYNQTSIEGLLSSTYELAWNTYHARLDLDLLELSEVDQDRLKKDSVILIPSSFGPQWPVALKVPALKYQQSGILLKEPFYWQGMMDFSAEGSTSPESDAHPRDVISCYFEISTQNLLRSGAELNTQINEKIANTNCILTTTSGRQYTGRLLSVGAGFGLQIEHVL